MANAKTRSAHGKRLRKLRRYYLNPNTYATLVEAVYQVSPTLTVLDSERITERLAAVMDSGYKGAANRKAWREWALAWVDRVARLTVMVKEMIPALTEAAAQVPDVSTAESVHAAHRVLNRLDEYPGELSDSDALSTWAQERAMREALNVSALTGWIAHHRRAVYDGLRSVLDACIDLGLDQSELEMLEADVWRWAAENATPLTLPGAPIHLRLRARAVWIARAWKKARLTARDRLVSLDALRELPEAEDEPIAA